MYEIILGTPNVTLNLDTKEWLILIGTALLIAGIRYVSIKVKKRKNSNLEVSDPINVEPINEDFVD